MLQSSMWITQSCGTSGQVSWHTHVCLLIWWTSSIETDSSNSLQLINSVSLSCCSLWSALAWRVISLTSITDVTLWCSVLPIWGLGALASDERLGDPPLSYIQELLVVRDRDGRPPRGPWQCTASVCVVVVCCWGISWVSRSMERTFFCLSCRFSLGFSLRVFIEYRLLIFYCVKYSIIWSYVLVVLV